jgi:hypothetical protein
MSLSPRFNIEFGKSSFVIYDTTCVYDSCSNETGYGTPNKSVSQAVSATVDVYIPGETVPVTIDLFPYLPNSNGTGFEIFYDDLKVSTIAPGEWKMKYTITFSDSSVNEVENWFLNTCPIDCCLADRVKKIDIKCGGEYDAETFMLISLLEGAVASHRACDYDKAHKLALNVYNRCKCGC